MRLIERATPLLGSGAGSLALTAAVYRLWEWRPGVPLSYSGDSLAHVMVVKQMVDRGWFFGDTRLGAPFGQHFRDWPLPEVLPMLLGKLLSPLSSHWAAVANGMFILSFPLAALSACWVLGRMGVSRWNAAVLGILYSLLPYHMVRGIDHLFLAAYYTVPLGVLLAWETLAGTPLFPRSTPRRALRSAALCVLVGLSGAYYSAFTVLFLVVAAVVATARDRRLKPLASGVAAAALVLAVAAAATLPTLLYRQQHGDNVVAARRAPADTELYGLKLAQMLVPAPGHRIAALDELQVRYYEEFPVPSERGASALGVVGAVGLVHLLVVAVRSWVRRRQVDGVDGVDGVDEVDEVDEARGRLALLTVVGLLVATIGGVATFVALLVSPQIRSWNRMSVFLALFALAAVGLLADQAVRRLPGRLRGRAVPVIAVVLLLVGVLDQTSPAWAPPYEEIREEFLADQAYFRDVESRLPAGTAVFQLPRAEFPEGAPVGDLGSYGLLKPYLHTNDVRWSFGGIKGRLQSAWQDRVSPPDSDGFLFDLVAAGFHGLYIDRSGYADGGAAVTSAITRALGSGAPVVADDGGKVVYDLRPLSERLHATEAPALARRRAELLFPVFIETAELGERVGSARFSVYDASAADERARFTFRLGSTGTVGTFTVAWGDGSRETIRAGAEPVLVTKELVTPRGRSAVTVSVDSGQGDRRFRLLDAALAPA